MIVVACTACGFGRVADAASKKAKCAHCGKTIDLRKAVRHYDGDSAEAARAALFILNAGMKPQSASEPQNRERVRRASRAPAPGRVERRSVERFLAEHESFRAEEFGAYLGIGEEEAGRKLDRLVEAGALYSPTSGNYRVV